MKSCAPTDTNCTAYNALPAANIPAGPAAAAPGAPTLTSATAGNTQVTLVWTAPTTGGAPTGYMVSAVTTVGSIDSGSCTTTSALSCAVSGLANGTAYTFTVTASNSGGTSAASNSRSATPVAPPASPGAPTLSSATPGDAVVTVEWIAPSTGGAPTGYSVTAVPSSGPSRSCSTTTALTCVVTGLTNGTQYSFTVTATNSGGTSPASNALTATPAEAVPGAPTLVSAVAGDAQVTLTWSAPTTGGTPSSYAVTRSPSGASCVPSPLTALSCVVTGLTNGTQYSFTVTATNSGGTSPASNALTARPAVAPGVPTVTLTTGTTGPGNKGFTASWVAVTNGGAPPVTYKVRYVRSTSSTTCPANPTWVAVSGNVTSPWASPGLTNNDYYCVQVQATNASSISSAWSASAGPVQAG